MNLTNEFDPIREWAKEKGIDKQGDPYKQMLKLQEEVGELANAMLREHTTDTVDGIGDCIVVLTNLATLCGFDVEFCINSAYKEIKNRKGMMVNQTFVKDKMYGDKSDFEE